MARIQGYSVRAVSAINYPKPAWHGRWRRKGWAKGYWKTVRSLYGDILYTTPEHARRGAWLRVHENESR
jgi:hypothetical protein